MTSLAVEDACVDVVGALRAAVEVGRRQSLWVRSRRSDSYTV